MVVQHAGWPSVSDTNEWSCNMQDGCLCPTPTNGRAKMQDGRPIRKPTNCRAKMQHILDEKRKIGDCIAKIQHISGN
jgi:hypothetical protein